MNHSLNAYYPTFWGGHTIGDNFDLNLKIGRVVNQNFKTEPTLPFYFQLGYNRRF